MLFVGMFLLFCQLSSYSSTQPKTNTRSSDYSAAKHLLSTLKPASDPASDPLDSELSFLLHEAHIDYLTSRGSYSKSYNAICNLAQSLATDNADVLQRVSVLLMKAELFCKVGKPERGFSIALRAASVAFKSRLMPSLWRSVGVLANLLNVMGEYASARRMLEGVLPQVCFSATAMSIVEDD